MKEPKFLLVEDVLAVHQRQLELFGGSAGIRDLGLLESAVATPQASFGGTFLHGTLSEMGAAYLFHLAQNHPFIDGNKRTATEAAIVFLQLNRQRVEVSNEALVDLVLRVATRRASKADVAVFFDTHSRAL